MSDLSEQSQSAPWDPSNYAPRWLREKREKQSTFAREPREKGDLNPEPAAPPVARAPSLDQQLENAVFASLRRSLDPEVMPDPPGLELGADRRLVVRIAGLALAVGVAVVVALFIAIMLPTDRQPNSSSSLTSTLANSTAAAPGLNRAADESKPALAQFKGLLTTTDGTNQSIAPRGSGQLLRQFLEWREKASQNDPPQ